MNVSTKIVVWVVVLAVILGGLYLWHRGLETLPGQWAREKGESAQGSIEEIRGEVGQVSADAGAFVLEDDQGRVWSVVVDSFTQAFDGAGALVAVGEFPGFLVEGVSVLVILDTTEEGYGTALLIRVQNNS